MRAHRSNKESDIIDLPSRNQSIYHQHRARKSKTRCANSLTCKPAEQVLVVLLYLVVPEVLVLFVSTAIAFSLFEIEMKKQKNRPVCA